MQVMQECKVELCLGSYISCYICFTKLNFSLIIKVDVPPCLNILFWPHDMSVIILLKFGISILLHWSINARFRCKLKLSFLRRLEWSYFISFLEDINDQKSNFVEKMTFHPIEFFWEKRDGHSKRERMEIINQHLKRIFPGWKKKNATNSSNIFSTFNT